MHQRRGASLREWPTGRPAVFVATDAGPTSARRLAQLGVRSGSTVTPVQRTPGGGLLLAVAELRLALDRETVAGMRVQDPEATRSAGRNSI